MADNKDKKVLNVPALRFPEFSGEWDEYAIGEILSIGNGRDYKHLHNGDIPVFGTGGYMTSVDDFLYDGESVFVGRKGTINKPLYYNGKFWTVDTLFYTYNFTDVLPKFVYCLFQTINWLKYNEASGVPSLSKATIEKIKVRIPSMDEQDKLSNLLFLLDKRIEVQNKIIEKLETLIKGIRHKVFKQLRKDFGFNSTIGDILSFEQPQRYIVSSAEYSNDDTFIPVLTANKAFILGYTTETDGIYDKGDCIIIDDFTLDCKYVSFPFKVKSSAIKILTANNKFILRYTYEYLKSLELSTEEHKRHYITEIQPYSCVLPDENTLKTIALVFENLAYKLSNEQSLALILNKQRQYLLSKMFI
ncbi:restriction endonuclease subunit S [Barnesiella viscericola]|uniref:restriction endonuclease subunit S n=1 Tax=Barnesiella viscericola TaxID=397865 RepID=UPI00320865D9